MSQAEQTITADEATVVQLGDVTERMVQSPISGEMIPVKPLKDLPKSHKHLAKVYHEAKGFTVEDNGNIAFHF